MDEALLPPPHHSLCLTGHLGLGALTQDSQSRRGSLREALSTQLEGRTQLGSWQTGLWAWTLAGVSHVPGSGPCRLESSPDCGWPPGRLGLLGLVDKGSFLLPPPQASVEAADAQGLLRGC